MFSKAARWAFRDNACYIIELATFVTALVLQRWSWWILVAFVISFSLVLLISSIRFYNEEDQPKKAQQRSIFSFSKVDLVFYQQLSCYFCRLPSIFIGALLICV